MAVLVGEDMAEALFWRVGSISYMNSHNIVNSGNLDRGQLLGGLRRGIKEFQALFQVRELLQFPFPEATLALGNDGSSNLYDRGILSSMHMLALMYSAELHFWLTKYDQHLAAGELDSVKLTGSRLATTYLQAAEMIPGEGWNTTRAKEILAALSA